MTHSYRSRCSTLSSNNVTFNAALLIKRIEHTKKNTKVQQIEARATVQVISMLYQIYIVE